MEPVISVVIPTFNSFGKIEETCRAVAGSLDGFLPRDSWEIIVVDDKSVDMTWETVTNLNMSDRRIRGVRLAVNSGQQTATFAGLLHSSGTWTITMDDDLGHDPCMLETLYDMAAGGYDIVFAPAAGNADTLRKAGSAARDFMFSLFLGKPPGVRISSFRILSRRIREKILSTKMRHINISALALKTGARPGFTGTQNNMPLSGNKKNTENEKSTVRMQGKSRYTIFTLLGSFIHLSYYAFPEGFLNHLPPLIRKKEFRRIIEERKLVSESVGLVYENI